MFDKILNSDDNIIVIHSSLKKFLNHKEFIKIFLNEVDNLKNDKTFLFPCFNYEFLSTGLYDYNESKSQVGSLCNIIKENFTESIKSKSPVFPFIVLGKLKNEIFNCDDSNCFSDDSVFGFLNKKKENVKYVHLNCMSFTHIHYWEQKNKVNYRYLKEFIGKYKYNNIISEYKLNYFVRDLYLNPISLAQEINEEYLNLINYEKLDFMGGIIYHKKLSLIDSIINEKIKNNMYILLVNKEEVKEKYLLKYFDGINMFNFISNLFPICRSITGNGNRTTLNYIKNIIPINIIEVASGTEVFDWTVPKEWNIKNAYIEDLNGNKIIDFNNNNLHILNYSIPFNNIIKLSDLQKHLFYLEELPNTIPYLTSYYKENWGFCLTYNQYKQMNDEYYKVVIDSTLTNGSLTYGELIIKGRVEKEILLSSYICHPSMCNDSLSGVALLTYLVKFLLEKNNYYTYRIIFIPETIGSITYLYYNLDIIKKNIIGGYVITCVGDEGQFTYLETRKKNQLVDKITSFVFNKNNISFKKRDFITCGSDERQFNYPGIDLNIGSIMKSKYGEFNEYHTSDDNLSFITSRGLYDSLEFYKKCIYTFENNLIYINNKLCEPRLSKYNLYSDIGGLTKNNLKYDKIDYSIILKSLYYFDGTNDVITISQILNITFDELIIIINILLDVNLIKLFFQ
jgi:hypothetical protein